MNNKNAFAWLSLAKRIQAIAQAGLEYSDNKYDMDRYQQIRQISLEIVNEFTDLDMEKLTGVFASETGYATPKVDVRGVVFRDNKILMVRETIDDCWSVPGGWADIGLTPSENACKEVFEESGLVVSPVRLLAIFDKKCHAHPPDLFHIYKIFILCREISGDLSGGMETSDAGFFSMEEMPPLSIQRITMDQIKTMFEFKDHPQKEAITD